MTEWSNELTCDVASADAELILNSIFLQAFKLTPESKGNELIPEVTTQSTGSRADSTKKRQKKKSRVLKKTPVKFAVSSVSDDDTECLSQETQSLNLPLFQRRFDFVIPVDLATIEYRFINIKNVWNFLLSVPEKELHFPVGLSIPGNVYGDEEPSNSLLLNASASNFNSLLCSLDVGGVLNVNDKLGVTSGQLLRSELLVLQRLLNVGTGASNVCHKLIKPRLVLHNFYEITQKLNAEREFLGNSGSLKMGKDRTELVFSLEYAVHCLDNPYVSFTPAITPHVRMLVHSMYPKLLPRDDGIQFPGEIPSSQLFYRCVADATAKLRKAPDSFSVPKMLADLLPFQKDAVTWMLNKEGVKFNRNGSLQAIALSEKSLLEVLDSLIYGWELRSHGKLKFYFNQYTGALLSESSAQKLVAEAADNPLSPAYQAKALLCDEMGLGKTVETIALTLLNQRSSPHSKHHPSGVRIYDDVAQRHVTTASTTLIVAPKPILHQWVLEISRHAPHLSVLVYEGLRTYNTYIGKSNTEMRDLAQVDNIEDLLHPARGTIKPKKIGLVTGDFLARFDVVLTSFTVMSAEVGYALFNPTLRPTRLTSKAKEESAGDDVEVFRKAQNLTSPLVALQFFRVILDEVQLAASPASNPAVVARMIPRVHSWGVSGTPVARSLHDLHGIFRFHRLYPLEQPGMLQPLKTTELESLTFHSRYKLMSTTKNPWNILLNQRGEFERLVTSLAIRHNKKSVEKQLQLPEQRRVLIRTEFTPVERNNYDSLFSQFLRRAGYESISDARSNPRTIEPGERELWVSWLIRLRQACCHAHIGTRNRHAHRDGPNKGFLSSLGTLEELLQGMVAQTEAQLRAKQRAYYGNILTIGQIAEYRGLTNEALEHWEVAQKAIEAILSTMKKELELDPLADESQNSKATAFMEQLWKRRKNRIRNWTELLHRCYFFIASAHFQLYNGRKVISSGTTTEGEDQRVSEDSLKGSVARESESNELENVDYTLVPVITEQEFEKHKEAESFFYAEAKRLRHELLREARTKVETQVSKLKEFLSTHPVGEGTSFDKLSSLLSKFSSGFRSLSMEGVFSIQKVEQLYEKLQVQNDLIREWETQLMKLLIKPVVDTEQYDSLQESQGGSDSEEGKEYDRSLQDQEDANTLLEFLGILLADRQVLLTGSVDALSYENKQQALNGIEGRPELYRNIASTYIKMFPESTVAPAISLPVLIQQMSEPGSRLSATNGRMNSLLEDLTKVLNQVQKEEREHLDTLRKHINVFLRDSYNTRIEYYRQLQVISDNVAAYDPESSHERELLDEDANTDIEVEHTRNSRPELEMGKHVMAHYDRINKSQQRLTKDIAHLTGKLRYLRTLQKNGDSNATDRVKKEEKDLASPLSELRELCVICQDTYKAGAITSCGHKYCRACLEEWLSGNHNTCPICKMRVYRDEIYYFNTGGTDVAYELLAKPDGSSRNEHERQQNAQDESRKKLEDGKSHTALAVAFHPADLETLAEINRIPLEVSYGAKVDLIVRHTRWLRAKFPGVQLLIFSQFKDFLEVVAESLTRHNVSWVGADSPDRFRSDPSITCFLLSTKAHAAGLTLVNATHVYLCEPLINTAIELQAVSRIHRIGQTKPTFVWQFLVDDSVEESIMKMTSRVNYAKWKAELSQSTEEGSVRQTDRSRPETTEVQMTDEESFMNADMEQLVEITKPMEKMVGTLGENVADEDLWGAFFTQ